MMNVFRVYRHPLCRIISRLPRREPHRFSSKWRRRHPHPPTSKSLDKLEFRNLAVAKSVSYSPAPPPQSSPSALSAVNLSESASVPYMEGSAQLLSRADPSDRVRTKRLVRYPRGCAQGTALKVEEALVTRDRTQDCQMYNVAGKARYQSDDTRPARQRRGCRDGPLNGSGKGKPKEWGPDKREHSVARPSNSWPNCWNAWRYDSTK